MSRNITVGIDIGTYQVKVVVAETVRENTRQVTHIIGTGLAESKGLRHGYIINGPEVKASIKNAVKIAEEKSGVKIHKAFVAVGGIGLTGLTASASIVISRADLQITELDIEKLWNTAGQNSTLTLPEKSKHYPAPHNKKYKIN